MPPSSREPELLLRRLASRGIQLGLERPRRILAALGDPQLRVPSVLVAGSNGKGSTAALLAAMATAAGYTAGLYTSPHLESVEEEVTIGGRPLPADLLGEHLERAVAAARQALGEDPTPFEAMTAAAFLAFAGRGVDLMVLEAGMGGARDATNTAEPAVSLVTSVSLEHRSWLGDTLEEIAREKAGVFRAGRPAVARAAGTAEGAHRVRRTLEHEAAVQGARFHWLPEEVAVAASPPGDGGTGQRVELRTPAGVYRVDLPLAGTHQAWNLALAVRAAELLAEAGWDLLDAAAISAGAAACRWPGRLEELRGPGGVRVLLDAAHNPEAVRALAAYLDSRAEPFDLLFGVFTDKDAGEMLTELVPRARRLTLTRPPGPRGRDPAELAALLPTPLAGEGATPRVTIEANPGRALEKALAGEPPLVVVCGSLALVGWVRGQLRERSGQAPP